MYPSVLVAILLLPLEQEISYAEIHRGLTSLGHWFEHICSRSASCHSHSESSNTRPPLRPSALACCHCSPSCRSQVQLLGFTVDRFDGHLRMPGVKSQVTASINFLAHESWMPQNGSQTVVLEEFSRQIVRFCKRTSIKSWCLILHPTHLLFQENPRAPSPPRDEAPEPAEHHAELDSPHHPRAEKCHPRRGAVVSFYVVAGGGVTRWHVRPCDRGRYWGWWEVGFKIWKTPSSNQSHGTLLFQKPKYHLLLEKWSSMLLYSSRSSMLLYSSRALRVVDKVFLDTGNRLYNMLDFQLRTTRSVGITAIGRPWWSEPMALEMLVSWWILGKKPRPLLISWRVFWWSWNLGGQLMQRKKTRVSASAVNGALFSQHSVFVNISGQILFTRTGFTGNIVLGWNIWFLSGNISFHMGIFGILYCHIYTCRICCSLGTGGTLHSRAIPV